MIFSFGIDLTIANTIQWWLDTYPKFIDTEFNESKFYEAHRGLDCTDTEFTRIADFVTYEDYLKNVMPVQGMPDFINRLINEGHSVYLVTSRNLKYGALTTEWLNKWGIKYTGIIFGEQKSKLCSDFMFDYIFESRPENVEDLLHNTKAFIYVKDYIFNRESTKAAPAFRLKAYNNIQNVNTQHF